MKKDIIIAVLVTFCLTITLFTIIPINSQSTSEYDPWADINDDGMIDMKELGYYAKLYGMTGDPTKNVSITDWIPPEPKAFTLSYRITWSHASFEITSIDGKIPIFLSYIVNDYTRICVLFSLYNLTFDYGEAIFSVNARWHVPAQQPNFNHEETIESTSITVNGPISWKSRIGIFETKMPYLCLKPTLLNPNEPHAGEAVCSITVFMTY